ncbi:MAG: hypothetical protein WA814_09345 [Candidatus Baltobacteraceae bacterium]
MIASARIPWGRVALQALVAGIAAGFTYDLYIWLTTVLPQHGSIAAVWQLDASTVVGKIALSDPGYAWLGVAIHALVSIGWAGGYAYLALRQRALNERWVASGLLYGIVVYVVMQLILLAGNAFAPAPNPTLFLNAVVAHSAFFGLPVAFVVKILQADRAA